MKISTGETLQKKFAAESKFRIKSQAQKRKKWFSRYRTWAVRRRVTRNNQKTAKTTAGVREKSRLYLALTEARSCRRFISNTWVEPGGNNGKSTHYGKIPNCHQRKRGERKTLADPKKSKQDRPHCWCPGTRLKHNQDRNNQEEVISAEILPQISKLTTSPY